MKNDNRALLKKLQMTKGNGWTGEGRPRTKGDTAVPVTLNHGCHYQEAGISEGPQTSGSKRGEEKVPSAEQDYLSF